MITNVTIAASPSRIHANYGCRSIYVQPLQTDPATTA